ncbi:MAG: hypothetical protein H0V86_14670 [Chloroflexia bacterium]|nr:hypothetical protein [Chloroflexia bacterium]
MLLLKQVREDWWQVHRAVRSNRPEAVIWRLQRLERTRCMHALTLPELLVASGSIR